jgi:hypothetical protein
VKLKSLPQTLPGRLFVLGAHEEIDAAAAALEQVLKTLASGEEPTTEALRMMEAYSGEANDAARGIGVITSMEYAAQSLLYLISDESDEPDQVAMLQKAYEGLMAVVPLVLTWVTAEIGEIGGPEDNEEPHSTTTSYSSTTVTTEAVKDGDGFAAGDFAYVPDPAKPSTWKLRLVKTPGGDPDPGIVGAAIAALGKGFRGQKVDIPTADLPAVKAKVRKAWKAANPDKDAADMPEVIGESAGEWEIEGNVIPIEEAAVRSNGMIDVKLIAPGWGSSGYYSPQLLERDGPAIFAAGTHMFWDHPGYAEEADRPERSLRDLAAVLAADARYDAKGPKGPGLYAPAQVLAPYREALNEMAPFIGVSIRTKGLGKTGEAEGKRGPIIEKLLPDPLRSADFITVPGAGGQVLPLFESFRHRNEPTGAAPRRNPITEVPSMDLVEAQRQLTEAQTARDTALAEAARAKEALILREARDVVAAELATAQIPDITRTRLAEALGKNPALKDGALDAEALKAAVKEAVAAEVAYLAKVTGSGQVRGLGAAGTPGPEDFNKSLTESFRDIGLDESTAKLAARGRE